MGQVRRTTKDLVTHYTLSLWRMHYGKLPIMIASQDVASPNVFTVYNDQVYYSHDGQFAFLLILNNEGYLDKILVLKSDYL